MTEDLDEEVQTDLRLRSATEKDPSRSRIPMLSIGTWVPDPVVGHFACRSPHCRKPVEITEIVSDRFYAFNDRLKAIGQEPIQTGDIMWCDECRERLKSARSERRMEQREEMQKAIRAIRDSADPRSEHDLLRTIEKLHHPDIRGLLDALDPPEKKSRNRRDL